MKLHIMDMKNNQELRIYTNRTNVVNITNIINNTIVEDFQILVPKKLKNELNFIKNREDLFNFMYTYEIKKLPLRNYTN